LDNLDWSNVILTILSIRTLSGPLNWIAIIKILAIFLINWTRSSCVISNKGDYVYELGIAKEKNSLLITPTLTNCGF
jgi:hypothetical protein